MPRAFQYIFQNVREREQEGDTDFLVRTSYFEIYNEHILDLLDPSHCNLLVREDIKKGVYVEGLTEEVTSSMSDMNDLIKRGISSRHVGSTAMNERSSRSHSVLTATIESKTQKDGLWNIRISRFHIIDLAGSERSKNANTAGERLKEASMINKSLSTLGNVINSLVEVSEGRLRHIHYRDSKLTFLLRDSLGGNSKTLIIANISPSSNSFGETLSTLKFAQRAKLIKNKAIINEDSAGTVAILKEEIKRLKLLLAKQQNSQPDSNNKLQEFFSNTLERLASNIDEDEESESKSPEKETSTVTKKRILELEKLLRKNLDYNNQIQEYYDKDLEEKDQIIKKLQSTIDSFEKQRTRDKMIIKFRDSTISKFTNLGDKLDSESSKYEIQNRQSEIDLLKQQIESNPQTAKLFVENKILKKEKTELKKNVDQTSDSLHSQYKSAVEFTASLNKYIKEYIEKEEMSREDIIRTQVDIERAELKIEHEEDLSRLEEVIYQANANNQNLVREIAELDKEKQDVVNNVLELKQEIENIKEKASQELEIKDKRFAESLEQVKAEVKEGKDTEIQEYKIKLIEAEKVNEEKTDEIAKLLGKLSKSDTCIDDMKGSLDTLQKEKLEFLDQIDKLQQQIDSKQNQIKDLLEVEKLKIVFESENSNLKSDIKKLEKSISKLTEDFNTTTESLSNLQTKHSSMIEENDTVTKEYEYKLSQLTEENLALSEKYKDTTSKLEETSVQLNQTKEQLDDINSRQANTEKELRSHIEAKEILELELNRANSKSEDILKEFEQEKDNAKKVINDLEENIKLAFVPSNQSSTQTDSQYIDDLAKISDLEKSIRHLENEIEKYQIDKELARQTEESLKQSINKSNSEYEELQQRYSSLMHQNNSYDQEKQLLNDKISTIESKNEWLAASEIEHKQLIIGFEKEIQNMRQQSKEMEEKIVKISQTSQQQDIKIKTYEQTIENDKEKFESLTKE